MKKRIPLLTQRKYYRQTRYGYARGHEALNYVENIRRYYQSIIGFEQAHRTEIQSEFVVETEEGLQTIVAPDTDAAATVSGEGTLSKSRRLLKQAKTKQPQQQWLRAKKLKVRLSTMFRKVTLSQKSLRQNQRVSAASQKRKTKNGMYSVCTSRFPFIVHFCLRTQHTSL